MNAMTSTPTPILNFILSEAQMSLLQDRDYTLIVGRTAGPQGNLADLDRAWQAAFTSIQTLLAACEQIDQDGVTLYMACQAAHTEQGFQRYDHVNSLNMSAILSENYPPEILDFVSILKDALDDYFLRKAEGRTKRNGESIIALIDGEPGNRSQIIKMIVQATRQISRDEELSIGLLQVGDDPLATGFFAALDDHLHVAGAQFDIVDAEKIAQITPENLMHFLVKMIDD